MWRSDSRAGRTTRGLGWIVQNTRKSTKEEWKQMLLTDQRCKVLWWEHSFTHSSLKCIQTENIIVNIYSGEVGRSDISNNSSLEIGVKEMIRFQESLPDGFMTALKTKIVTISTAKKKSQHTEDPVVMNYNANLIVSQVLYLVGNQ